MEEEVEKVFEVYRPITTESVERLGWFIEKLVEVGGFPEGLSTVQWGDSPRVELFSLYGDLAEEFQADERERLEDLIETSGLDETITPETVLWSYGLNKGAGNGRLTVAEKKAQPADAKSLHPDLFEAVHQGIQFARAGECFPKRRLDRPRENIFADIDILEFSDRMTTPSMQRFRSLREHPSLYMPVLELGPVTLDFRDADDAYRDDYGYLAAA